MILTFYGGARSVTGANYLLESGKTKILIDCGLFQGFHFNENLNREKFSYDPSSIDAVFLTHAHIDHSGRLPKLVKEGFRGKIYATPPTIDLTKLMLEDSAGIMRYEAKDINNKVLFDKKDVARTMELFRGVEYKSDVSFGEDLTVRLRDAGHILGSAMMVVTSKEGKIVFSGDLGNPPTPFLKDTAQPESVDWVVMESTYGDRNHKDKENRKDLLENIIEETIARGGVLMIPSFALERTQELLYELNELVENHRIQEVPVFVDSPLAIKATEVYSRYQNYFNEEAIELIKSGDKLFNFPRLKFTRTVQESKAINDVKGPKIIIAGSGMSNGGRILHHERRFLSDPKSTLLFVGYQASRTLGRRILEGAEEVTIFRETIPVKCHIASIDGYSAHADQETLLGWVRDMGKPIKKIFAVQGEEEPANALVQKIRDTMGIEAEVPALGDTVEL